MKIVLVPFLLGLLLGAPAAPAQTDDAQRVAAARQLCAQQEWDRIVQLIPAAETANPELLYYRGLALARLERWDEAEAALETGERRAPRDPRFLVERAGVAYKQGRRADAKAHLHRALALDPQDAYAREFLATIYFLEENLEAALVHWNRIGRPVLTDLYFVPEPRLEPELRERAVDFSLGQVWRRKDYLASQARLDNLGIFPRRRFELAARSDGTFEAIAHMTERNGWGGNWVEGLFSLFRGLPYQTIYPEFYNLNRSAINFVSQYRWDIQKRRIAASLAWPLGHEPARRARIYFDARNENWDVANTVFPSSPETAAFNLQKFAGGVELRSVVNGRFQWSTGLEFAHRRFRNPQGLATAASSLLRTGLTVDYRAGAEVSLLRFPEHRLFVDGSASGSFGRFFASPSSAVGSLRGGLRMDWFPRAQGDDYRMQARFRLGRVFGEVPFDELFMLGYERDNSLWLRAHIGTRHGRKGDAPLGRGYVLANWEIDKNVYENAFLGIKVGPFVDTGTIAADSGLFGSPKWLWDAGGQVKVSLFGRITVALVYGHDLRSGRNTFHSRLLR